MLDRLNIRCNVVAIPLCYLCFFDSCAKVCPFCLTLCATFPQGDRSLELEGDDLFFLGRAMDLRRPSPLITILLRHQSLQEMLGESPQDWCRYGLIWSSNEPPCLLVKWWGMSFWFIHEHCKLINISANGCKWGDAGVWQLPGGVEPRMNFNPRLMNLGSTSTHTIPTFIQEPPHACDCHTDGMIRVTVAPRIKTRQKCRLLVCPLVQFALTDQRKTEKLQEYHHD